MAPLDTVKSDSEPRDYFVVRDGQRFAGSHYLIDLWGANSLTDIGAVERILREAAADAGATVLHGHFHRFSENDGISGVLVLAESHISIHTWPECDFAAIDIFLCGDCDPANSIPAIRRGFSPETITIKEERRGVPR